MDEREKALNAICKKIGEELAAEIEAEPHPRSIGFVLFLAERGEDGFLSYMANVDREDAVTMLLEWIGHLDAELLSVAVERIQQQQLYGKERAH